MTIKTFNTGRDYSAEGQRIAYQVLARTNDASAIVAMVDVDRGISFMLDVDLPYAQGEDVERAKVLLAYDTNQLLRDLAMDSRLESKLQEAARNHGVDPLKGVRIAVVPVDATRAMIDAAQQVEEDGYDAMLKAMVKAAPQAYEPKPIAYVDNHALDQLRNGRGYSIGVTPAQHRREGQNNPLYADPWPPIHYLGYDARPEHVRRLVVNLTRTMNMAPISYQSDLRDAIHLLQQLADRL